jgi:hypothetical protein
MSDYEGFKSFDIDDVPEFKMIFDDFVEPKITQLQKEMEENRCPPDRGLMISFFETIYTRLTDPADIKQHFESYHATLLKKIQERYDNDYGPYLEACNKLEHLRPHYLNAIKEMEDAYKAHSGVTTDFPPIVGIEEYIPEKMVPLVSKFRQAIEGSGEGK